MSLSDGSSSGERPRIDWVRYLLMALIIEKIIQHCFVTLAFIFDWGGIGATVAVSPGVLIILGAMIAVLFMLSLWGMIARKQWAPDLILALALIDILGEFIAQGKLAIQMNLSFLGATALLILVLIYRRRER